MIQPRPKARLSAAIRLAVFALVYPRTSMTQFVQSLSLPRSSPPIPPPPSREDDAISRRDLLYWPIGVGGAIVYGKLVSDAVGRVSRGDLVYPQAHERQVSKVISESFHAACRFQSSFVGVGHASPSPSLRVLEVGIGKDCRVLRRGLYDEALKQVAYLGISKVDILGIDLSANIPSESVLRQTRETLERMAEQYGIQATLDVRPQSITQSFTLVENDNVSRSFDVVLCFLTLCSVDDLDAAIQQIRRLTRPDGGVFGYVEHVAVSDNFGTEKLSNRFLEWQQQTLDPLQQVLADNCHLHRYTNAKIAEVFHVRTTAASETRIISQDHFLVDDMWPVSFQVSGVLQRLV